MAKTRSDNQIWREAMNKLEELKKDLEDAENSLSKCGDQWRSMKDELLEGLDELLDLKNVVKYVEIEFEEKKEVRNSAEDALKAWEAIEKVESEVYRSTIRVE